MAKYAEIIAKSKDEKEKAQQILNAKKAGLNVERAVLDASSAVEEAKSAVEEAKAAEPFDLEAIIIATRELADAEQDLADIKAVQAELF